MGLCDLSPCRSHPLTIVVENILYLQTSLLCCSYKGRWLSSGVPSILAIRFVLGHCLLLTVVLRTKDWMTTCALLGPMRTEL